MTASNDFGVRIFEIFGKKALFVALPHRTGSTRGPMPPVACGEAANIVLRPHTIISGVLVITARVSGRGAEVGDRTGMD